MYCKRANSSVSMTSEIRFKTMRLQCKQNISLDLISFFNRPASCLAISFLNNHYQAKQLSQLSKYTETDFLGIIFRELS